MAKRNPQLFSATFVRGKPVLNVHIRGDWDDKWFKEYIYKKMMRKGRFKTMKTTYGKYPFTWLFEFSAKGRMPLDVYLIPVTKYNAEFLQWLGTLDLPSYGLPGNMESHIIDATTGYWKDIDSWIQVKKVAANKLRPWLL